MTIESPEARLKRLTMRSCRRGIKEMDLILGQFARQELAGLPESALHTYDRLLSENDHDLYRWVTGQGPTPTEFRALIELITDASEKSLPGIR